MIDQSFLGRGKELKSDFRDKNEEKNIENRKRKTKEWLLGQLRCVALYAN